MLAVVVVVAVAYVWKRFVYLPNRRRTVVTWCRSIWGPRCTACRREQPESSTVHSRSATQTIDVTHTSVSHFSHQQNTRIYYLDLLIDFFEHWRDDKGSLYSLDLLPCGPDVSQENLFAITVNGCRGDRKKTRGQNYRLPLFWTNLDVQAHMEIKSSNFRSISTDVDPYDFRNHGIAELAY